MIASVIARQIERGVADFLRTTFPITKSFPVRGGQLDNDWSPHRAYRGWDRLKVEDRRRAT